MITEMKWSLTFAIILHVLSEWNRFWVLQKPFLYFLDLVECDDYRVEIKNNGPVVRGAEIQFHATLFDDNELAKGEYIFYWEDNAFPSHNKKVNCLFSQMIEV